MSQTELTLQDILNDPLILQVMQADGISTCQLLSLLGEARDRHGNTNYRDHPGIVHDCIRHQNWSSTKESKDHIAT
ncbi:hypothetical protein [Agrobacterium burrii]|uniref:Uncharacterized protein n=1 Tax=Agrobacterium burrii TaxID=2815339 RepID=A0ABS3EIZ0_9HYPH|nr:hypothetical protein [Agrobacterium burrii]MBO0131944.1 hypothetical protein [Agrobacterium burrii]